MPSPQAPDEYELLSREDHGSADHDKPRAFPESVQSWPNMALQLLRGWTPTRSTKYHPLNDDNATMASTSQQCWSSTRRRLRTGVGLWIALGTIPIFIVIIISMAAIFIPSYTHRPKHYQTLHDRIQASSNPGRANIGQEKIFIAAAIRDEGGKLVAGAWGEAVLELIDILGPDNVYLSVYENDPDEIASVALQRFSESVDCNSSIIAEHIDTSTVAHVTLPSGLQRLKRIALMAEVRNRALRPMDDPSSPAYSTNWDKLLYLNDVIFDPVDAANLLFSTNLDEETQKSKYKAACATDFINPFRFYDTFATRDAEGHSTGIPFFPWFSKVGDAISRKDVLDQRDAVRVKSCWGGMVAFDGKWFQPDGMDKNMAVADLLVDHNATGVSTETMTTTTFVSSKSIEISTTAPSEVVDFHPEVDKNLNWHLDTGILPREIHRHIPSLPSNQVSPNPIRFRASMDTFWDASECCLLHADLTAQALEMGGISGENYDTGIYMNPYIRVAYTKRTLRTLAFTRRIERLYTPFHKMLDWIAGLPTHNPRRTQVPGEEVVDRVWAYDDPDWMHSGNFSGRFRNKNRTALPGGFCGGRWLLALQEGDEKSGQGRWWYEDVPADDGRP